MKVKDKKIIVTGAGNGLGKQITLLLLSKGAHVAALDINEEYLKSLQDEINNEHLSIHVVDITNDESINNFKAAYLKINQSVDGLINNAGVIQPFKNFNELDLPTVNRVMNINFFGALKLTKLFLPELLKQETAHIINISSMGGFFPFPGQTIYGASKAALKLFTEGLYAELLDTNVNVTIALPGAMATNIAKNSNVDMGNSENNSNMKMLTPEKAAEIVVNGMEKNKFKIYVGSDSKFMNFLYKINDKFAIKYINKQMQKMQKGTK